MLKSEFLLACRSSRQRQEAETNSAFSCLPEKTANYNRQNSAVYTITPFRILARKFPQVTRFGLV